MSVGKDFVNVINDATKSKTSPRDIEATVSRVDGKTAWVRMPGSETETPVKLTIDAKKGDTVQVRVSKGRAWITGNTTAPPTDDKVAKQAMQAVSTLSKKSVKIQESVEAIEESIEDGEFTVEGVYVQYILSTSNSSVVPYQGMDWSDTLPTYVSGCYYWTRTVTVTEDEEEHISEPVLDLGAQLTAEVDQAQKSTNNHFWHDNTGAYVTEQNGSYATGYAVRITNSGIIQSYNGNMLSSWTGSGVSFYQSGSQTPMATFGSSGITFDNTLPFTIGNTSGSYIKWYQENNIWKIKVVADEITFGGSNLATTLSNMDSDIDAAESAASSASSAVNTLSQHFSFSSSYGARVLSDSYNYSQMDSSGLTIYKSGSQVASFGNTASIGSSSGFHQVISNADAIYYNGSTMIGGVMFADDGSLAFASQNRNLVLSTGGTSYPIWLTSSVVNVSRRICSEYTYNNRGSVTSANLYVNSNGNFMRIGDSSSRRYKEDIEDAGEQFDPHGLYDIPFRQFRFKQGYFGEDCEDSHCYDLKEGFIAEEVYEHYPAAIVMEDGKIETWGVREIVPPMLALIQEQNNRISELERRIS